MSKNNDNYNNQRNNNQQKSNHNNVNNEQQGYNQQYTNYNNQQGFNQQSQNYSNNQQGFNQQYHNYGNGQQGFNEQYQNYNNNQQGLNQQYQNFNNNQQGFNQQYQNYSNQKNPNFMNTPQNLNNNFNPNKKKRSKFIPIISTILGVVLIGSGGLFYYSKTTNKSISSIFSTSKNDEEIYAPILEKYKKSMDNNELGENSEVNKFAIKNYEEYGKEKNYITYSYYDVDEDGKNELVIAEIDKPNSPFAVYSYNSNKIIVLYQAESRNDIPRANFYKDRTIWIHTKEKKDGKYLDTISNNQFSSLEDFLKNNKRSNDKLDFSKSDYRSVYTYNENKNNSSEDNKETSKVEYTNSQLTLIGRALLANSTNFDEIIINYESPFIMSEDNGKFSSSMGTGGSTVQVIKTNDGIEIQTLDYDKPVGQRDFKTVKKATYKEIKEKITEKDLERINSMIEQYKKTKSYQENKYRIKD